MYHRQAVLLASTIALALAGKEQRLHADNSSLPPATVAAARARLADHAAKLNAPWTGDDRPYQDIRTRIESDLAAGQPPASVLKRYEDLAKKNSADPTAVFGWGYAAYQAATRPKGISQFDAFQELGAVYLGIARIPSPRTYNFARLMFLRDACNSPSLGPGLLTLGERLLARDPNDYDVKFYMASILGGSRSPTQRQRALAYAQDLVTKNPQKAAVYSLRGGVYYNSWLKTRSKADADKAVSDYQKYLQMTPPDHPWRPRAMALIKEIEAAQPS